jgi:hypothetical protein
LDQSPATILGRQISLNQMCFAFCLGNLFRDVTGRFLSGIVMKENFVSRCQETGSFGAQPGAGAGY